MTHMIPQKFKIEQNTIFNILGYIDSNQIAIPEIQRPFVWNATKVRDFIDSLYNGYPTGYLIIWQNPDVRLKDGKSAVGKQVLIDGQQRVMALCSALVGRVILTDDYEEKVIKIAFNPLAKADEDKFAVQTPAHVNDKTWISDISVVFKSDFNSFDFVTEYVAKNPDITTKFINDAIEHLRNIVHVELGTIKLMSDINISEVTEIFVRINSRGSRLNEADFAMSKIAADEQYNGKLLRKAIDYFSHLLVDSAFYNKLILDQEFVGCDYFNKIIWVKDNNEDTFFSK